MLSIPRIRLAIPTVLAAVVALALAVPAVASAAEFSLTINVEPGAEAGTVECEVNGGGIEPCEPEYEEGDEVNLVPEAEPGYEFFEFYGDCGPAACELKMDENHEVTAVFLLEEAPEFPLNVATGGEGEGEVLCAVAPLGLPELCEAEYPEGTQLTLIAEPEFGSFFEEWEGDCSSAGSETECELEIDGEKSVEAIFGLEPTEFALNIEEPGSGEGTVTCEAEEGPGPCLPEYPAGTVVTLTAEAEVGSEFVEWEGCDSVSGPGGEECEVEMSEEKTVVVIFEKEFTGEPPTVTSVSPNKGTTAGGTVVTITGTNLTGATEVKFGSTAATGVEVKSATEVKATSPAHAAGEVDVTVTTPGGTSATGAADKFTYETPAPTEFTLTIVKNGTGSGTVTCNGGACAAKYVAGSKVTLAASAASGSTFAGWSGGGCSGTGSCVVTINANTTVTATFNAASPPPVEEGTLTVSNKATVKSGKALLKVTCSGGPCKGSLKLTAKVKKGNKLKNLVIGKASFSLASGASGTLKVKLSGPAKQELAKGKTVKAKVTGTGVASSTVKLKNKKKK